MGDLIPVAGGLYAILSVFVVISILCFFDLDNEDLHKNLLTISLTTIVLGIFIVLLIFAKTQI